MAVRLLGSNCTGAVGGLSDIKKLTEDQSSFRNPRVPRRGDIIGLDVDPRAGHEQQGLRPAQVLSPEAFNRFGLALVCPIARGGAFARGRAWTVPLVGAGLPGDGVVLSNQERTVDLKARMPGSSTRRRPSWRQRCWPA